MLVPAFIIASRIFFFCLSSSVLIQFLNCFKIIVCRLRLILENSCKMFKSQLYFLVYKVEINKERSLSLSLEVAISDRGYWTGRDSF